MHDESRQLERITSRAAAPGADEFAESVETPPAEFAALAEGWRAWSDLQAATLQSISVEPFDAERTLAAIGGRLRRQQRRRRLGWLTAAAASVLIAGGVAWRGLGPSPDAAPVVATANDAADVAAPVPAKEVAAVSPWDDDFDAEIADVESGIGQSRWTACQWPSDSDVLRDGIRQVAEELALETL